MGRTGRRPGESGTRQAILAAAREAFATRGYDNVTIRQLASAAAVNPALVHHFFGTKEQLFRTVLRSEIDPDLLLSQLIAEDMEMLGERIVGQFLHLWEGGAGANASALLRAAVTGEWGTRLVREVVFPTVADQVTSRIGLDPAEAPLRIALIASQLSGLAIARYLLKLKPLATMPTDAVTATVGPTVQRYVTGELPDAW